MRAVFIGASALCVMTARFLLERGHEVVIIEKEKSAIDALSNELDCGFLHADGSKPAVLREADPEHTDVLYCLTNSDQANIISSLVGRSLGFGRVVTKIVDPEFEHICIELGLEDTIIPARTVGRYLAEMFEGTNPLEISALIKADARVFSFVARDEDAQPLDALELPDETRVICIYRNEKFLLPNDKVRVKAGDEVLLITHARHLPALAERWTAGGNATREAR
ncbi:MAG: TrkA family potassium uptake protein [Burkholderiales bacterium]|nr:TrkA family potassium uptake protein [Burkholderiales bacterium]